MDQKAYLHTPPSSHHPLIKNGPQCFIHHCLSQRQSLLEGNDSNQTSLVWKSSVFLFKSSSFFIWNLSSARALTPSVQASPDFFLMRGRTPRGSVIWLEAGDGRVQFREETENVPWMLMRRCPAICSHAPPDQSASNCTMTGRGAVRPPAPTCSHHTLIGCDR